MTNVLTKLYSFLDRFQEYSPLILRLGLGFVFMWFGWSGLTNPSMWTGLVPDWTSMIAPAKALVRVHGTVELIGGLLLFAGIQTRLVSGFLFVVLVHTLVLLEPGATMVRDVGLATGLLALTVAKEPMMVEVKKEAKSAVKFG